MNMGRFFTLGLVLVLLSINGDAGYNNSSYGCNDGERRALLKFKTSLKDPLHKLSSWEEGTDCCKWEGIGCDTTIGAGHVVKVKLDLGRRYSTEFDTLVVSKMISCLVELKYLNYLDLSWNRFDGWASDGNMVPAFLGVIEGLEYLNLSHSNAGNLIVPQLGNLTNLQILDLSYMTVNGSFGPVMEDLQWVSRLSSLKRLDMSGWELNGARNLWQVLGMLPSLSVLALSDCGLNLPPTHLNSTLLSSIQELHLRDSTLEGPFPQFVENMTSLRVLDLGRNFVNASIPMWLGNLKNLMHLDLSVNEFNRVEGGLSNFLCNLCYLKTLNLYESTFSEESLETNQNSSRCIGYDLEVLNVANSGLKGYLPDWFGQFKKLKELDLSRNSLHGPIPASIGNLQALKKLDLSKNQQLNGVIPTTIGNLSALTELHLSNNQLNGVIPTTIGNLSALTELHLSNNQLNGVIPTTIGNLFALTDLDFSQNQLNGVIPDSIGQLSQLKNLDLSSNSLKGEISEIHFSNLSKLKEFRISSNHLNLMLKPHWLPPFQLQTMEMGSCQIGTMFPQWLETQKELTQLVLSNASISGPLPKWFQNSYLHALDLSLNQITGPIPQNIADAFPKLESVQLAHNLINGTIPSSFCKMEGLRTLDLSHNMLSGVIPSSFGNLSWLSFLHLNNNSLKGEIPVSFKNTRSMIRILNLGDNGFSGNIPKWIGTHMRRLQILRLQKNMFDGYIPPQLCQLEDLQILDLAGNNLIGTIPRCLGNLTGMIMKPSKKSFFFGLASSLFANKDEWDEQDVEMVMKAKDQVYTKILQLVVNMDLSGNKLVGIIPEELSHLLELIGLNLSHNHLTGNIPKNIGSLKSLESLDLSKNQLSGNIPTSMSNIPRLSYLNLSHNSLSGKIPTGQQLQTLVDPSIYADNPELCGDPLLKRCPGDEPPHQVPKPAISHEENDEEDKIWFYLAITLGYGTGLWIVIGVLLFKKKWRYAYFRFADETKDQIFVAIVVNAVRLKKKIMRRNCTV